MVLLIDNYDSFFYNLFQLIGEINSNIKAIRNDDCSIEEIKGISPTHIIISSGTGLPQDTGICSKIIKEFSGLIPILGVGLGHKVICEVFGEAIVYSKKSLHGKKTNIKINNQIEIFKDLPEFIDVAGYYSSVVKGDCLPDKLLVIAENNFEEAMAVRHRDYDVYGVQFNPESILTPQGKKIMQNFLNIE